MLENLLLTELPLKLQCQSGFLQFARNGAVLAQKNDPSQLLGNRARPLTHGTLSHVGDHRPCNAPSVDAIVLKKPAVFRSDKSVLNQWRHGARLDFFSSRRTQFLDDLALGREQRDGSGSIETGDSPCIGKRRINQLRDRTGS